MKRQVSTRVTVPTRLLASVLLLIVSLPWFAPLAASTPDSGLPACCRRDGKHHCAMMARYLEQEQQQSTSAAHPIRAVCVYLRQRKPLVSAVRQGGAKRRM
jgi:hypothetical protein